MPLAEKALIKRIRGQARRHGSGVITGIGDDSSVLRIDPGQQVLITTDFTLEGIHFRREWHPPDSVGHRCLARGLSDIAAMGGAPVAAFLSLALARDLPQRWIDRFVKGVLDLAKEFHVTLAGGDTAESPGGVLADIMVFGSIPQGKAILRSGARPGDRIYVTGKLGASAAALNQLFSGGKNRLRPDDYPRHFYPTPRIEVGRCLCEKNLASAMIDVSDGLSTDLDHICEESGVGAEVQSETIPVATVGKPAHEVDLRFALHGGDDYELLFTAPRNKHIPTRIAGIPVARIGHITGKKRVWLIDRQGKKTELLPQGWQHFVNVSRERPS